jgi:hypothetical protein
MAAGGVGSDFQTPFHVVSSVFDVKADPDELGSGSSDPVETV